MYRVDAQPPTIPTKVIKSIYFTIITYASAPILNR
jgi:hypothetical protein